MSYCEYTPWGRIHNALVSSQLKNGANKLMCLIALGWKGSSVTSALAYMTCNFS
jgi:hypothetical protein